MKKIIILGSNGFIGKNLKNHFEKEEQVGKVEIIYLTRELVDLRNKDALIEFIRKENPTIIINASGIVGSSRLNEQRNEDEILNENNRIIMNLLDGCLENKVEKLILFSSYRVFGNEIHENYDESDIEKGIIENNRGYLESKKIQDREMKSVMEGTSTLKVICMVMTNVFGEEDRFVTDGRIVPALITKMQRAKEYNEHIFIDSFSDEEVNLVYVQDIVKMVEQLIEQDVSIGNILIFNKKGVLKIGELSKKIAQIMEYSGVISFKEEQQSTICKKNKKNNIMKPNLLKMEKIFPEFEFTDIDVALKKVIHSIL
jgi:nucleoside-diphosphate-sugar epimerase